MPPTTPFKALVITDQGKNESTAQQALIAASVPYIVQQPSESPPAGGFGLVMTDQRITKSSASGVPVICTEGLSVEEVLRAFQKQGVVIIPNGTWMDSCGVPTSHCTPPTYGPEEKPSGEIALPIQ